MPLYSSGMVTRLIHILTELYFYTLQKLKFVLILCPVACDCGIRAVFLTILDQSTTNHCPNSVTLIPQSGSLWEQKYLARIPDFIFKSYCLFDNSLQFLLNKVCYIYFNFPTLTENHNLTQSIYFRYSNMVKMPHMIPYLPKYSQNV